MSPWKNIIPKAHTDKIKKHSMPGKFHPMLAKLTHDHFSDADWIYERKWDGIRCVVLKTGKKVQLLSRNQKKLNDTYPEIEAVMEKQDKSFILDGEIVAFSGDVSSFSRLQGRMQIRDRQQALETDIKVYYYVFDLPACDGYDLEDLPLRIRKSILKEVLDYGDPLRYTSHRNEEGIKFLREACRKKWEGLIAKKADSSYHHSRTSDWLKFKCVNRQEFVIGGFTGPKGQRIGFGALLIGYYKDGKLRYAGKVGTGYSDKQLKEMSSELKKIETGESPYGEAVDEDNVYWVKPEKVCEVGFTEWTDDGKLRHPRFIGMRYDKEPENVIKE